MSNIHDRDAKFPEVATNRSGLMAWLQVEFVEKGFDSFDALIASESVADEWWTPVYYFSPCFISPCDLPDVRAEVEREMMEWEVLA